MISFYIKQRHHGQVSFQQSPHKGKWSLQPGLLCLYWQKELSPLLEGLQILVQVEKIPLISGVFWSMNEGTVLSKALTELLLVAWICHLTSPLHALEHCLMWFSRFLRCFCTSCFFWSFLFLITRKQGKILASQVVSGIIFLKENLYSPRYQQSKTSFFLCPPWPLLGMSMVVKVSRGICLLYFPCNFIGTVLMFL